MRGTIRDPALHDFKHYGLANEMYSIGWLLSYIFTGRDSLTAGDDDLTKIVVTCTNLEISRRYRSVSELIKAIDALVVTPRQASA